MMGSAALAVMMASTEAIALTSCAGVRKKRVVLYFSATGNCLYVAPSRTGGQGWRDAKYPTTDEERTV